MQKQFILKNGNAKLENATHCNEYEQGRLKDVNIFSKVTRFKCSWVNDSFHAWKVTLAVLIKNLPGKNFVFYANLR